MRCQQRAKRRCPRCSSDVLEADLPPPAAALELLPERLWRTSIAVGQSAFYPGQFMPCGTPGILADGATIVLHPDLAQRQSWLPSTPSREPPDSPTWDAASISPI